MKPLFYLLTLLLLPFTEIFAQTTFVVSSNADDGPGSLRVAITTINSSTLTGPFTITCTTAGPISLTAALPDITKSYSIIGINSTRTIIERSSTAPVPFRIFTLPGNTNHINFKWLTIRNGLTSDLGGAIFNTGALVVDQCLVTQNQSSNGNGGGGIFNYNGSLTVIASTISSNSVVTTGFAGGGGICQNLGGSLVIINSTIEDNYSNQGGGIASQGLAGNFPASVVIRNSLIQNNTATFAAGGVITGTAGNGVPASMTIINTTVSGNTSPNYGSEIVNFANNLSEATLYLNHCTIVGSSAIAALLSVGNSATITMQNTLASNTVGLAVSSSNNENIISLGHNLATNNPSSFTATGDLRNTNPLLLPLANNGGPTWTHALSCNSPAVNAGIASGTTSDQRGLSYVGTPDIGAYEFQSVPLSVSLSASNSGTLTCANPSLTLTASITNGTSVTYTFQGIGQSGTPTSSSTTTVSAAGTYTVTAQSAQGCTASATIAISSNTLTPGVSLSATNGGVLTCSNPVLALTASSTTGTATFSFGGPAPLNTASAAITVNSQGTYSVTATSPVNGCISSTTASVTSSTQNPGVSLSATNGGVITCGVETLTLTATSSTSGVSYSFASVNSFTQTGNNIVVNSAGMYSVTAINPTTGCYSVTSLTVSINLAAPPSIVVTRTGTIGCGPNSVTLTASASGATSYSLNPGGQTNSTGQFVVTVAGTYTILASSGAGASCQSQTTVVVSQGTNAVAGPITASGPASCGSPARLTAPATGQSFIFTGPGGYVFSNTYRNGGSYSVFAEGVKLGGTYTLTVYGSEGCPTATSNVVVQGPSSCP